MFISPFENTFDRGIPQKAQTRSTHGKQNHSRTVHSKQDWAFACGSSSQNILTYDSACTTHLIKDMHLIFDAKEYSGSKIAANNSSMDITHSGKMILPGTNETIDVLLCPSAIRNIISGAILSKIGYTVILNPDGTGKRSKDNININLTQRNGIWIFADFLECHHAKINEIMHRRLGHLGQDNLNILLNPKNKLISNCNFKSANPMCLPCSEAN